VAGFDVTLEGGWRGRATTVAGGRGAQQGASADPFRTDYLNLQEARQTASARYTEDVKRTEAQEFAPVLTPAEVLDPERPKSEFIGTFRISRPF
jgi:hypothetical protein